LARRFAIVCPNFYPRVCGVGDHSARLAAELGRRGHEVVVFTREPVQRHPEAPEVEVHGVPGRLPTLIAKAIGAALAQRRPTDVVFQYTSQMWDAWRLGSPALPLLAVRARRLGAHTTLLAHELFVPWSRRPDLFVAAALQRAQMAALLKSCDQVFVTTETRRHALEPYCRVVGAAPPGVIPIGANALPIQRAAGVGPDLRPGPRIGIFSTAAFGKRFDVVLDAFARVAADFGSAQLVLIGDLGAADNPSVRAITAAVGAHPARDRIRVTGRLPLAQIAGELAELDVFLFPMDTGANTRSGTLPAALGAGLPVVAIAGRETDARLFRDGDNIAIARELTGPAFAEATLGLLRDAALRARIAGGARRLYADHLSWERIADQLLAGH
jgi:glycosyltransferase involved in cell wall biosynthesis